ncbi:MAG: hypothetical protein IPG02_10735, partial [Ignavibacteria bacterium]|nr:hypothetical protein [Ignavibacteria bacterium]
MSIRTSTVTYCHSEGTCVQLMFVQNFTPFNKLLMECSVYFKQADDNNINANAFPVLTALQDLNLILAKGDVNQAVYFARQARIEILIEQQILNRSEIGDYLRERPLIPYGADWMRRVDAMKGL